MQGVLLATDLDGTLLTDDKRILDKDRKAISRYTNQGGLFTLATGRGVTHTADIAATLNITIPVIICNGAALYDFTKGLFLWQETLPESIYQCIDMILRRFPTIAAEVLINDKIYVIRCNRQEELHIALGRGNIIKSSIDGLPKSGLLKILFTDEPCIMDLAIEYIKGLPIKDIRFTRSSPVYYEALAAGVSKGAALNKLLEIMQIKNYKTAAIGDYYNDIEMIQGADIGIAPANAPDTVKAAACAVVCDNNSGAIYETINILKNS